MANEIQTSYYCINWRRSIKCICVAVCAIPEKKLRTTVCDFHSCKPTCHDPVENIPPVVIKAQPNLYQKKQLNKVDMTY